MMGRVAVAYFNHHHDNRQTVMPFEIPGQETEYGAVMRIGDDLQVIFN